MDPIQMIQEEIGDDVVVTRETRFDSTKLDSLDFISLIQLVEKRYDVIIPNDRISGIKTIGDLLDLASDLRTTDRTENYVSS